MYKIYLISTTYPDGTYYKIGRTKRDPIKRLKELKTANSQELNLVSFFESKWGPRIEVNLHRKFKQYKCEGEWFKLPKSEAAKFIECCQHNHDIFTLLEKNNTWFNQSKKFSKYLS